MQRQFHSSPLAHGSSRVTIVNDGVRSVARQSFDGMPEKLVYGLFEAQKNKRFLNPRIWSPPNPRQVEALTPHFILFPALAHHSSIGRHVHGF
jgi:hypothetical protein